MSSEARRLPESLVRGLLALLSTPFFLLAALGFALWAAAAITKQICRCKQNK